MKTILEIIFVLALIGSISCAQNKTLTITAHRGASAYAPENTISAMNKAIEMNSDFSELDVQETADGVIILLHDNTLERTAGVNKNIWELNYDDLSDYEVGAWFDEKYKGEAIPTLQEVVEMVKGKMKINIELKTNGHEKQLADLTVKVVKENKFETDCIFTSFDFSQADRVKEIDPSLKAGYIFSTFPENVDVFKSGIDVLSVHYKLVDESFMEKANANKKEVHVWTVNEEDEMKRMIDLGVASIITNYPDRLANVIREYKKEK